MKRKTADEILSEGTPSQEVHDWLETAKVKDLHRFLRLVKSDGPWVDHARDALASRISTPNWMQWTILITALVSAIAAVIVLFYKPA